MEALQVIRIVIVVTLLFAMGGKVVLFFKNREMALLKEKYEQQLVKLKEEIDLERAKITESGNKVLRMTEDNFKRKLDDKDKHIQELIDELESMKAWKEEIKLSMAKFEGASQGSAERMLFKLLDYNQKLSQALNAKWQTVEDNLTRELASSLEKIKAMFASAEKLHQDGIEIISEYEARLPEDFKRKVHDELLQLTDNRK